MLNLLHPKNTIDVSIFVSVLVLVVEGIVVWLAFVIEVVSISLAIVVEIVVDTTSDKVWVTFTMVVCALFDFSSSSLHLIFPSLSVLPTQI